MGHFRTKNTRGRTFSFSGRRQNAMTSRDNQRPLARQRQGWS